MYMNKMNIHVHVNCTCKCTCTIRRVHLHSLLIPVKSLGVVVLRASVRDGSPPHVGTTTGSDVVPTLDVIGATAVTTALAVVPRDSCDVMRAVTPAGALVTSVCAVTSHAGRQATLPDQMHSRTFMSNCPPSSQVNCCTVRLSVSQRKY